MNTSENYPSAVLPTARPPSTYFHVRLSRALAGALHLGSFGSCLYFFIFLFITFYVQGGSVFTPTAPKEPMAFEVGKTYTATIKTNKGDIVALLRPKEAPFSVTNFIQLANGGYYNGLTFHRVEPGFVVQGGDPLGNGTGGPGYTVQGETKNGLKHVEGALAWARTSDQINPKKESSGSQFYITLAPTPFLDGEYTVFGHVTQGMDVVKQIARGDKIVSVLIQIK